MSVVPMASVYHTTAPAVVFTVVSEVCARNGLRWYLTSNHRPGALVAATGKASKHAIAEAWDFQFKVRVEDSKKPGTYTWRWATNGEHDQIATRIAARIGHDFDVLSHKGETTDHRKHVHVELDPKDS